MLRTWPYHMKTIYIQRLTFAEFSGWANETVGGSVAPGYGVVAPLRAWELERLPRARRAMVARWTDLARVVG